MGTRNLCPLYSLESVPIESDLAVAVDSDETWKTGGQSRGKRAGRAVASGTNNPRQLDSCESRHPILNIFLNEQLLTIVSSEAEVDHFRDFWCPRGCRTRSSICLIPACARPPSTQYRNGNSLCSAKYGAKIYNDQSMGNEVGFRSSI